MTEVNYELLAAVAEDLARYARKDDEASMVMKRLIETSVFSPAQECISKLVSERMARQARSIDLVRDLNRALYRIAELERDLTEVRNELKKLQDTQSNRA